MRDFVTLLKSPCLTVVLITQLAARFPAGMYSLGLLMHVASTQGNYTSAGLVLGAFSIGMAIAGPVVSRQLSRFGSTPVLLVTLIFSASTIATLAALDLPLAGQMALAAIGGAAIPPVVPTVRTLYPKLVPTHRLTALFAFDAALQEVIWVFGPVLITVLVAGFGTSTALLVVVGIQVAGGLVFALSRSVRSLVIPPAGKRLGRVLHNPSVLLMTATSMMFIGAFAAIEAAVVATFGEGSMETGLVLAISSFGSLLAGLVVGNRQLTHWSLPLRLSVVVVGFAVATLVSGFWGMAIALFIAGLGIAPALAAVSSVVAGSVPFSETAEAYGWIGTGQLLGSSVGSMLAGVAIDNAGGHGGVLVAFGIGVLALLIAVVFRNAQPDLRASVLAE